MVTTAPRAFTAVSNLETISVLRTNTRACFINEDMWWLIAVGLLTGGLSWQSFIDYAAQTS